MSRLGAVVVVSLLGLASALYAPPADACMAAVWRPQRVRAKQAKTTAQLTRGVLQVAVAHDGQRTTWTLSNEVKGNVRRFSLMIPVPGKVSKRQVRVVAASALAALDKATAPRVERRTDPDPCQPLDLFGALSDMPGVGIASSGAGSRGAGGSRAKAADFGVKVESHIQVGGYDIAVLKAEGAAGLAAWLRKFKYDVPQDVESLMGDYLEHDWRFLVARVNLKKLKRDRFTRLKPLQISFPSPRLELPIRLAGVSSSAPVDMVVFVLTDAGLATVKGRESQRMPTDVNIPAYAGEDLTVLHSQVITQQLKLHPDTALLEYSGAPRSTPTVESVLSGRRPTSRKAFIALGARWVKRGKPLWISRYRLNFTGDPVTDLLLEVGAARDPFEVRYVARRPWQPGGVGNIGTGGRSGGEVPEDLCLAGQDYLRSLGPRVEKEIATLVQLTGRDEANVRRRVGQLVTLKDDAPPPPAAPPPPVPDEMALQDSEAMDVGPSDADEEPQVNASELSSLGTRAVFGLLFLMALLVGFGRWQRNR